MSFVLSVVCVQPLAQPKLPSGPLLVEEAIQAPNRACFLPALRRYFRRPIVGRCYHVYPKTGGRFTSSRSLFFEPLSENKPARLALALKYHSQFTQLLSILVQTSKVRRALVLCEFNGNVTWDNPSLEDLEGLNVRIIGPVTVQGLPFVSLLL